MTLKLWRLKSSHRLTPRRKGRQDSFWIKAQNFLAYRCIYVSFAHFAALRDITAPAKTPSPYHPTAKDDHTPTNTLT